MVSVGTTVRAIWAMLHLKFKIFTQFSVAFKNDFYTDFKARATSLTVGNAK